MSSTTIPADLDASPIPREARHQRVARALFRMMLSGIFIVAGVNHLLSPEKVVGRLVDAPMSHLALAFASPEFLVGAAGVGLLAGGVALSLGLRARLAALVLLCIIIPITLTVQVGSAATMGPLFKNIGLAGGLLFFMSHGADTWSFDSMRKARAARRAAADQGGMR